MENDIKKVVEADKVFTVIWELGEAFPAIFFKYNQYERAPENFYSKGHCGTFSNILSEIFKGYTTEYINDDHIITKIGDNFFDINGYANWEYRMPKKGGPYREVPEGIFDYDSIVFTSRDDHDWDIRNELIEIGKMKVHEIAMSLSEEETHQKSM